MERLVNICLVLSLIFVRFTYQRKIEVNIKPPNRTIFYSEIGKKPKEDIICESNCLKYMQCTYLWYIYKDGSYVNKFTKGAVLFLNKTVKRNETFKCEVKDNSRNFNRSEEISVVIRSAEPEDRTSFITNGETGDKFPSVTIIVIGIGGGAGLLLITIVLTLGILCLKSKQKGNKIRKCI
ncbi:uncharacterized protein LOC134281131 [Saccostrea cucullata]|uniref:uncharacterized protein LOC134281131 n=1 Tax=Saccostrea cuccullata TaxID=36930 RepID=UPI002ED2E0E8